MYQLFGVIRELSGIIYRPDPIFWRPVIVLQYDVITGTSDVITPSFLHHMVCIKLLYKCTEFHVLDITGFEVTVRRTLVNKLECFWAFANTKAIQGLD